MAGFPCVVVLANLVTLRWGGGVRRGRFTVIGQRTAPPYVGQGKRLRKAIALIYTELNISCLETCYFSSIVVE